jgi:hypothetical protein
MVALNCLVIGDGGNSPLSHIFPMEVPPAMTIGDLREQIKQRQIITAPSRSIMLYSSKQPISTASYDGFNKAIFQLKLDSAQGRSLTLDILNPTSLIRDYAHLKSPTHQQLHIFIFASFYSPVPGAPMVRLINV